MELLFLHPEPTSYGPRLGAGRKLKVFQVCDASVFVANKTYWGEDGVRIPEAAKLL